MLSIAMPNVAAKSNKSDFYYTLPNGSEIWIGGLDSKERTEKILGTEYSTMYFNETSQIDYSEINLALTRLAEKSKLAKKAFYDSNPPTKSSWQYLVFEKGINPIDDEPLKEPKKYASFKINPIDNLDNIDEEYIALLESMPEETRKRFLEGEYQDISDGQAYYAFRHDIHVKPVRVQVGTKFIGMDFNVEPMTAAIFQVVNGQIQAFDEVYIKVGDTPKMIEELKKRGYAGLHVIPDSTSKNRKTSGKSDFELLREAGFKVEWSMNPLVYDRVVTLNLFFTNNKIIIDPKCKKLINDLERVSWKDNKLDQKGDNKMLTHISDAFGYGVYKLKDQLSDKPMPKISVGRYR
jgi:phage terminase large subunit